MMIEKFKPPKNLFELRRTIFLILQECLDDKVVDAVIHQDRHNDEYISIQFNDKIRTGDNTSEFGCLPDVDLLFLTHSEHKLYRKLHEQHIQAQIAAMDDDDEDDA